MAAIKDLQSFAVNCVLLDLNGIYDLFEDYTEDTVRDEIVKLSGSKASEPVREGLNKLGYMFGIKSLINY